MLPGWRPRLLGPVVRGGARLGQFVPPEVWRRLHPPLAGLLFAEAEAARPRLDPLRRRRMVASYADDIHLLSRLTGQDFGDWLSAESRGSYAQRAATVTQLSAHR